MPNLFVITGANGAGKSTLSKTLLPEGFSALEVFDGDKFFVKTLSDIFPATTKSPKYARDMAFEATVTEFEQLVEQHIQAGNSFAYEGHFSSESPWQTIVRFRDVGYHITMIFLMVKELSISLKRVSERVQTGGHFVTSQEIEKNYYGNLIQLNKNFQLLDELIIADNSKIGITNQILYLSDNQKFMAVSQQELPSWLVDYLPEILKLF